jgi:hypothetical protein
MSRVALVLVHSPLLGSSTWRPVADALVADGYTVARPSLDGVFDAPSPYYPRLVERVAQAARPVASAGALVLVGHSGAGALLAASASAIDPPPAAVLFVDAILPHPGASWLDTAPPALAEQLRALARDGRLPTWDQWLPPGTVDGLLPDAATRGRFLAELPHVPLSYFAETAPRTEPPPPLRYGYLRLSPAYEEAATEADRRGWPTLREETDHLAMLTRPAWAAEHLLGLLERLGLGS